MKSKVAAFTLMEIVVAMLLSAIVISLCYTAYGLIQQYYIQFEKRNQASSSLVDLKTTLEKDLDKANLLRRSGDAVLMIRDSLSVNYYFSEKYVVREIEELKRDTFNVRVISSRYSFEDKADAADTLDRIDLVVGVDSMSRLPLRFVKIYSSTNLYNDNQKR